MIFFIISISISFRSNSTANCIFSINMTIEKLLFAQCFPILVFLVAFLTWKTRIAEKLQLVINSFIIRSHLCQSYWLWLSNHSLFLFTSGSKPVRFISAQPFAAPMDGKNVVRRDLILIYLAYDI